jgi:hypothetical protein
MPSDEDLYRFGMACQAGKPAGCRELALIYLPDRPDPSCGSYATDDPNGPIVAAAPPGRGRHRLAAGDKDKPACKPPMYRHLGACGDCELPRVSCGYREHGDFHQGGPFGHASSKCPAGEWCTMHGVCFPKSEFPVEGKNLARGERCYFGSECASGECYGDGFNAFGDVGRCN